MMRTLPLFFAAFLLGCDAVMLEPTIASIEIEVVSDVMFPGDTVPLTPLVQNEQGEYLVLDAVTWESSDTTVVRVTEQGRAIAVRPGAAAVRMRYRDAEALHNFRVDSGFVFVEAGAAATCAFRHTGELYCWGYTRSYANVNVDAGSVIPRRVDTELRFKQFSIGSRHMCAVTFEQTAYCWGSGEKGVAGNGDWWVQSSVPLAVSTDVRFTEVSAAWEHSCGLATDGVAYCWGRNAEKQIGRSENGAFLKPVPVDTELRFKQLQAAGSNTCGLTLEGDAYCWGHRDYLGDSTITEHQAVPRRINVPRLRMFDSANDDPCGITFDSELYCWTNKVELVASVGRVSDVTVGGTHVCVITLDGRTLCYGNGTLGQLGDGTLQSSVSPVQPAGSLKFLQISAGGGHTCGIADTGATYCWGRNRDGQVGDGSRADARSPARVLLFR